MYDRYTYRGRWHGDAEWCYGDLVRDCGGYFIRYLLPEDGTPIEREDEINPVTLGLCVCLPDKNGATLFEGDILEDCSSAGAYRVLIKYGPYRHITAQCEYTNGDVGFYCEVIFPKETYTRNDIQFWAARSVRVGNVHDNPELMGVQDDVL